MAEVRTSMTAGKLRRRGTFCGLSRGLEKSLGAFEGRREDAGVRGDLSHAGKKFQTDHADTPFPDGSLARGNHQAEAGEEPGQGQAGYGRPQQHGTHFVAFQSAAGTSRPIARSISSATSTASWRWSRRSSTIRTAARASRCCIMWTARSATFWRRSASKWDARSRRDRKRIFWSAIRCRSRIFRPARWFTTSN